MIRGVFERRRFMREHGWTNPRLGDYAAGDLSSGERRRVEEHVGLCPECRRVLAAMKRTLEGLVSLRDRHARAGLAAGIIDRLRQEGPRP